MNVWQDDKNIAITEMLIKSTKILPEYDQIILIVLTHSTEISKTVKMKINNIHKWKPFLLFAGEYIMNI